MKRRKKIGTKQVRMTPVVKDAKVRSTLRELRSVLGVSTSVEAVSLALHIAERGKVTPTRIH